MPLEAETSRSPHDLFLLTILFDLIGCESKEQEKDERAWSSDVCEEMVVVVNMSKMFLQ